MQLHVPAINYGSFIKGHTRENILSRGGGRGDSCLLGQNLGLTDYQELR